MVGHRLGEFSPTKKFVKHGGKMQKELEQKRKKVKSLQHKLQNLQLKQQVQELLPKIKLK